MAQQLDWQRTSDAIPTWELIQDPMLYVEKWGMGSYAAYRGEERIGEPGTYGTKDEAMAAAEAEYRVADVNQAFAELRELEDRRDIIRKLGAQS